MQTNTTKHTFSACWDGTGQTDAANSHDATRTSGIRVYNARSTPAIDVTLRASEVVCSAHFPVHPPVLLPNMSCWQASSGLTHKLEHLGAVHVLQRRFILIDSKRDI